MINYQVMKKNQKINGYYSPDYEKLINNAKNEKEKEYIKEVEKANIHFVYNMVYITQQKCGHYEIFQTPLNEYYTLEKNIELAITESQKRNCTKCICNW